MNSSFHLAQKIVNNLLSLGVRRWVYCPGSRCAPLGYALYQASESGQILLTVRLDERAAAFEALGMARAAMFTESPMLAGDHIRRATLSPTALVMTSGTAVANAYPAVLEARHGAVPMLILSADRPASLRFSGANQTTDQRQIYGRAALGAWDIQNENDQELSQILKDAAYLSVGQRAPESEETTCKAKGQENPSFPGPVQLNISLTPPLTPPKITAKVQKAVVENTSQGANSSQKLNLGELKDAAFEGKILEGAVLICADGASTDQNLWFGAQQAKIPVFAEPQSGWRHHPCSVVAYRDLLSEQVRAAITRVIVNGRPTLSRPIDALISTKHCPVEVYSPNSNPINPAQNISKIWGCASQLAQSLPLNSDLGAKRLSVWQQAGARVARSALADLAGENGIIETGMSSLLKVAHRLWALPDQLMLAASMPIRAFDLVAGFEQETHPLAVWSNRGLAGIDGTIATATGLARATQRLTRLVIGDLAFWHDIGSLGHSLSEQPVPLQIIVIDNAGGQIFSTLEHRHAQPELFSKIFLTPQNGRVDRAAEVWGWEYRRVKTWAELDSALLQSPENSVIHIVI